MHCAHTLAETICSLLGNDVFWQFTALSTVPFPGPQHPYPVCRTYRYKQPNLRPVSIACNLHFKMYCRRDKNKFHLGFYLIRYAYLLPTAYCVVSASLCLLRRFERISPRFTIVRYFFSYPQSRS